MANLKKEARKVKKTKEDKHKAEEAKQKDKKDKHKAEEAKQKDKKDKHKAEEAKQKDKKDKHKAKENKHKAKEDKHSFWEKVEHYNAKLIPLAIVLLLFIIIYELFLHIENHTLELAVEMMDYFVIMVFIIDVIFLAMHSRSAKYFFKHYWLDVIAIFPFVLVFNFVSAVYRAIAAAREIVVGQAILHESLELGKSIKTAPRVISRSSKIARMLRIAARSIRIITKSRMFMKIKKHHRNEKKEKRK